MDDEFFATPDGEEFWEPYETGFIVNQLHLEVGIARNDAIGKNAFALFVGMCIRTTTFIVGKPNTSKSLFLSLDLLTGMMLTRKHPFWKQFPVKKKSSNAIRWSRAKTSCARQRSWIISSTGLAELSSAAANGLAFGTL